MTRADRELVPALKLLVNHYETGIPDGDVVSDAKLTVAHTVTAFAMGKLVERLVDEGYIREDRTNEIQQRGRNTLAGRGFLTNDEVEARELLED